MEIDEIFTLYPEGEQPPPPSRPISFVVVRFSDDYLHNFLLSDCIENPINQVIEVDNRANLFFDSLTQAMAHGIAQARHDLIAVVHEDVVLPRHWQSYFEQSLEVLERQDGDWSVVGSVGWNQAGQLFGRWKDPVNFYNHFADRPHGFAPTTRLDEQLLVFQRRTLPELDLDLPGIHHIGRDLSQQAAAAGRVGYIIDAPTIHKFADRHGNRIQAREQSDKIVDRSTRTYLADRACCNDYIVHKWPDLVVPDYKPDDFGIRFADDAKKAQLDSPIVLLGRGGSGTRLLGSLASDAGVFLGSNLNRPMDSLDIVLAVYRGIVEKYRCRASWQKEQTVPRLRAAAASMIRDLPADATWGFKLPETLLLLPEIAQAFPQARYVNYVRDPLRTSLRRTHMTARLDNHIGRITLPLAYDYLGLDRHQILNDSSAMHMAYTTLHQLALVREQLQQVPLERQFKTSFERVIAHPAGEVARLANWLNIEPTGTTLEGMVDPGRVDNPGLQYGVDIENAVASFLRDIRVELGYLSQKQGKPSVVQRLLQVFGRG
jgi:hypothetical protein